MIDFNKQIIWKEHPELTLAPGFDTLYEDDKSKDKVESSKFVWAIHLCEDPESKFYNHPKKYKLISKTVLGNELFPWHKYKKLVETYREMMMSDAQRALTHWNILIMDRTRTLKELYTELMSVEAENINTKSLKDIDSMLAATPKMFDDYKKVKSDYEEEKKSKSGSKILSLSDTNDI